MTDINPRPPHDPAEAWRFDKKVPLTVVFIVVTHLFGATWYAAQTSAQMAQAERRLVVLEAKSIEQERALNSVLLEIRERRARIEVGVREQSARAARN